MAITYNDISCLANFHLAKLFKTLRKTELNILKNYQKMITKKSEKR